MSHPAPGELELVRAFVNTWDAESGTDALGTPAALADWLSSRELLEPGAAANMGDLRRTRELREALRALLRHHHGEALDTAAPGVLERAARRSRLVVRFDGGDGESRVEPLTGGLDGALGRLLARVAAAMEDGTWRRLKVCPADDCQHAFFDTSRNRSAVWCDMAVCGNRQKVRSFRERRQGAAPAPGA